ncbi:MAG: carbohydrate ABC transporter permease [Treponema sp.]|jgi:multiple sugar transport system permease protein|nr:carbohydrate ABC transporter permease [Treponema sp.]
MLANEKARRALFVKNTVKGIVLWACALSMIYPLIWMFASSLRPEIEIFNPAIRSGTYNFANYAKGWAGPAVGVPFSVFYRNSFVIVFFAITGNLLSCSLTAYALSRLKFDGSKICFGIMLGTMMLPGHVTLIPRYIMFNKLGWMNTFLPMTVPHFFATAGFFIFLMIQFMRTIPRDFDESAAIDGCNSFRIFSAIILPLCKPVIITTVIFTFIWTWNDFFSQLLYITLPRLMTVSMGLRLFIDSTGISNWGALFAMSVLSLIPVFAIFFTCQRYLVQGVIASGVKG